MAKLPRPVGLACFGSDLYKMVLAGGLSFGGVTDEVLLLSGVDQVWRVVDAKLGGLRGSQAGVLIGDMLVCVGG